MSKLKECEVRIVFLKPRMNQDEFIKHLHKAESELSKIGVHFDTGHNVDDEGIGESDWEFDWSLEGAKVRFIRFKDKK